MKRHDNAHNGRVPLLSALLYQQANEVCTEKEVWSYARSAYEGMNMARARMKRYDNSSEAAEANTAQYTYVFQTAVAHS